jgi:hypothetical protein
MLNYQRVNTEIFSRKNSRDISPSVPTWQCHGASRWVQGFKESILSRGFGENQENLDTMGFGVAMDSPILRLQFLYPRKIKNIFFRGTITQ